MRPIAISNSTKVAGGGVDLTPNALASNIWDAIDPCVRGESVSEEVFITGIAANIDLKLTWTISAGSESGLAYFLWGTSSKPTYDLSYTNTTTMTGINTISVPNNTYLRIKLQNSDSQTRIFSIVNTSDGNAVLTTAQMGDIYC
jgi:hypothetical protein